MRFGACCGRPLAQLGGFLGCEAAQHLGKWHKGAGALRHFARGRHAGAGTRAIAARIAPRPSHQRQKWGRAGETGPCGSSSRAFARTAGPKLAKVCVLTPTLELDSQMPFRKHQVDCLRLWRLSSPWILKRILLAILSIRAGAKRARGLSRSPLDGGFG